MLSLSKHDGLDDFLNSFKRKGLLTQGYRTKFTVFSLI